MPGKVITKSYSTVLTQIKTTIESGRKEIEHAKAFVLKRLKDLFYGKDEQYLNQQLLDEGLAVGYKE